MNLYNELLYRPLFNLTVFLYNLIPGSDFGLAIIALTILTRLVFLPLTVKTVLSQRDLNKLNPEIKAVKEKYKNDKAAQSAAIMKLYKDRNINPAAGCVPLLIQLPILIALYQAFVAGFKPENLNLLYGFIQNPGVINESFIGLINIAKPNFLMTLAASAVQFIQAKQSLSISKGQNTGMPNEMAALNSQMLYFFPILIIIIGWNLPAGLMLYWITTTALSIAEQVYIKRRHKEQ